MPDREETMSVKFLISLILLYLDCAPLFLVGARAETEPSSVEIRAPNPLVSGRDYMLLCLASGFLPGTPSVQWFCRDTPVPPSSVFSDIIKEDDGTFYLHSMYRLSPTVKDHTTECVCKVSHPAWAKQWTVRTILNVSLEPYSMEIQAPRSLVSGSEAVLLCTASRFYPGSPSVLWFHRDASASSESITNKITKESDGTFSLESQYKFIPTETDHGTVGICLVSHPDWTQQRTVNITLNVSYGPTAVNVTSRSGHVTEGIVSLAVGSLLHLTCVAEGNPRPKIQWLWGNITVQHSTETLFIPAVLQEHEGVYWCVARNQYGQRNSSITLRVTNTVDVGVSACLLMKAMYVGILALVDVIILIAFMIRKTTTARPQALELSVSQSTSLPEERPASIPQTAAAPNQSESGTPPD
ncbi:hypothetical protein JZ751_027038 [Albula glossodonta]|uniref:Ig-like domain-containing protein n=1 Tax=Albula glossodonta TaxID=121402 RepID=A0A8T2NFV1_9TELE|nr:hypothetical protein JZ751_027038 [Albula glossodonta]